MNQGKRTPLAIDRDRVTCLLLINTQLMKKAINIYTNILVNQPAIARLLQQDKQRVLDQYQNYTRRLHCNLQVLTFIHEKYHLEDQAHKTSKTPFPIIVQAPNDMPELNNLYTKLQQLYPEAVQFIRMKVQQMKSEQPQVQPPPAPPQQPAPPQPQQQVPMTRGSPIMNGASQRSSLSNSPMVNNMMPQKQMPVGQTMPPQLAQQAPQVQQAAPVQQLPQHLQQMQLSSHSSPAPSANFSNQFKNTNINNVNFMPNQFQQPAQSISPQQIYQQMNNPGSPTNLMDFFN